MSNAPGFDMSAVRSLIVNSGVEVTTSEYDENDLQYRSFVREWSPDDLSTPLYGHKASTVEVGADPVRRNDGEQFASSQLGTGWTWQMACHEFARSFSVPKRQIEAALANPNNRAFRDLQDWQARFTRQSIDFRNRRVAEALAKGGITAGVADLYDGSYQDQADPQPLKGYDGVSWFNAAHPLAQSNATVSNAQSALTLDSAANLDTAYTHIRTTMAVDEQGRRISLRGRALIVPAALEGAAERLLNSELLPGGGNNDINRMKGRLQLVTFDYLDEFSTSAWFVTTGVQGLHVIDSGAPEFSVYDDPSTDSVIVWGRIRFGIGWSDWRWGLGCKLATTAA